MRQSKEDAMRNHNEIKKHIYLWAWVTAVMLLWPLLNGCSSIPRQPWTTADKAMFGIAVAAQGYDAYTTKRVLDYDGYIKSPWDNLYGSATPSTSTLMVSKAAQLGLAWIVLDRVPSTYRKIVLGIMTGAWVFYGSTNGWGK